LKTWLVERFRVATPLDDEILAHIAAHIPTLEAFEQFKLAAADAKPRKWAAFVTIARQCADNRSVYTMPPVGEKERERIEFMQRINARVKAMNGLSE
jgi:hypothetical protein